MEIEDTAKAQGYAMNGPDGPVVPLIPLAGNDTKGAIEPTVTMPLPVLRGAMAEVLQSSAMSFQVERSELQDRARNAEVQAHDQAQRAHV